MGATRTVALNELPMRGISINTTSDSGSITVVASDSGVIFVNKYTAGNVTYTLPAVADAKGKIFWFFNAQTTSEIIISAPADTMMMADDAAATTASTDGDSIGDCGFVICDGTNYYFYEIYGSWASA